MMNTQIVDWRRMAVPQEDGYDTAVTFRFAPHEKRSSNGAGISLCSGRVAIRLAPEGGLMSEAIHPAELHHPNISQAEILLARWPIALRQFCALIHTVYPYSDPSQASMGDNALGATSHIYPDDLGSIYATVDHQIGFAQALIQQLAYTKLRAWGVAPEGATRLIANGPAELFENPLRGCKKQPMSAVFCDVYAFAHVAALNLKVLENADNQLQRTHVLMLLARNIPRLEAGVQILRRHLKLDPAGTLFVSPFLAWSQSLIDQGQSELDSHGYGLL